MIGIDNVNEFYTNHYLAAIVSADVRPHVERWLGAAKHDETPTPWRRLALLQQPFFRFKQQLERVRGGEARVRNHHVVVAQLLDALGYVTKPIHRELPSGPLPLLGAWARADGEPLLWLLAAPRAHGVEDGLLACRLLPEQHGLLPELPPKLDKRSVHARSVEALVTEAFGLDEPPRFVLVLGDTEWVLADRGKWAEQRLLRFDWVELLGRRETEVLELVTALLHRETLAPASGTSLIDTLDDSSHKHAYEVSEELQAALRASIERIGNEAIRYRRHVSHKKIYGEEIDGQQLAVECIRYMYRILFLLYIEARPELGYAPMGDEAYRLGYSFERLRELEMIELDSVEAREGFYIDSCLKRLFAMVYEGTQASEQQSFMAGDELRDDLRDDEASAHHSFRLVPLRSHLFDPGRTKFLNRVKLRNVVLLDVIRAMSLSAPQGTGKSKRRGRISYATLGINQLGAVYEALLSFRGFFAEQTLFEVKPAKGDNPDPVKDPACFVAAADIGVYGPDERVFDADGRPRSYPPGSFIYRMAGRDRQKSASYYTPEPLTKCLVKYALAQLLEDEHGQPKHARAEDLLGLTICEPAMGSAAFLNEAINQLSERYLQRRQQELGERIAHDEYRQQLQRVRMYIADNNVYGVDLNPIALELAEVSLWLNAIFTETTPRGQEVFVPWFGRQLACGNSLVGAWRKVFPRACMGACMGTGSDTWLDAVPERVLAGAPRPKDSVYHFLLPDRGMAVYGHGAEGKPIRELCATQLATIEAWRANICAPLSERDWAALVKLSDAVDRLWAKHIEWSRQLRARTTDPLSVYGHPHPHEGRGPTTTEDKDRMWSKAMASEQLRASSPYRRLKLAMDYWCVLWFWPIEHADALPERDEWLADLALLLDDSLLPAPQRGDEQRESFAPTMPADAARSLVDEHGCVDVERLVERRPRLRLADELAGKLRVFHWELEHADLIATRGGFDMVVGNPPWIRLEWQERDVLADDDASLILHDHDGAEYAARRARILAQASGRSAFMSEYELLQGMQAILHGRHQYAILDGIQPNLYKCFLTLAWDLQQPDGVTALITDKGLYTDPAGGRLREACYPRLRLHFQFKNQLRLFHLGPGDNNKQFELAVYSTPSAQVRFLAGTLFLTPQTIDASLAHPGGGAPIGIKDDDGNWNVCGHADRLLVTTTAELGLYADIYDEPGTSPLAARLPSVFSAQLLPVLRKWAAAKPRLADHSDAYVASVLFDETNSVKKLGLFERSTAHATELSEWVVSGPHFHVANGFCKTPRRVCRTQNAYDALDLECLPDAYLPRSNFAPKLAAEQLRTMVPSLPWAPEHSMVDDVRLVVRRQLSSGGERTLIPALVPAGVFHMHSVLSIAFRERRMCLIVGALAASLIYDFVIKTTGRGDLYESMIRQFPVVQGRDIQDALCVRFAALSALTRAYADWWQAIHGAGFCRDGWAKPDDARLSGSFFQGLTSTWRPACALRSHYERRQALVEIDVLGAMGLGLELSQLQTVYRVQFPIMQQYEQDTWYDRDGKIVFTNNSRGLPGVGLARRQSKAWPQGPYWVDVQHMSEAAGYTGSDTVTQTITDDTLPGGPRQKTISYRAPWVRCDRERDYQIVWAHFAKRFGPNQA